MRNLTKSSQNLFSPLDKIIRDFYNIVDFPQRLTSRELNDLSINPRIDIIEDEKSFKVEAELPGVDENQVNVTINNGILSIKAEKNISKQDKDKNYVMREIGYGVYERNILLPDSVDIDKAKSTFKKGMLWIDVPKKEGMAKEGKELKIEKVD